MLKNYMEGFICSVTSFFFSGEFSWFVLLFLRPHLYFNSNLYGARTFCVSVTHVWERNQIRWNFLGSQEKCRPGSLLLDLTLKCYFSVFTCKDSAYALFVNHCLLLEAMSDLARLSASCPWGPQTLSSNVLHTSWGVLLSELLKNSLSFPQFLPCSIWLFPKGRGTVLLKEGTSFWIFVRFH